jgi:hypothetical protein
MDILFLQWLQGLWERGNREGMQWRGKNSRWDCNRSGVWLVANKGLQALSWIFSFWRQV